MRQASQADVVCLHAWLWARLSETLTFGVACGSGDGRREALVSVSFVILECTRVTRRNQLPSSGKVLVSLHCHFSPPSRISTSLLPPNPLRMSSKQDLRKRKEGNGYTAVAEPVKPPQEKPGSLARAVVQTTASEWVLILSLIFGGCCR